MKWKKLGSDGEQIFALVLDSGDEVTRELLEFARVHRLTAASFTAIGAFSDAVLGYFDWQTKEYQPIRIDEQVEVLSLTGDIGLEGDEPQLHAHVVVGTADGSARGGHLMSAHVRPTLELILSQSPRYLQRRIDRETGLALIDLDL